MEQRGFGILAVCLSNSDASIGSQILGIVVIFAWVFIASLVVWSILKATIGIGVSEEEEQMGMDAKETGFWPILNLINNFYTKLKGGTAT